MRVLSMLRWSAVLLAAAIVGAQAINWLRQQSPNVVETGIARVGAPFTLSDQNGRLVSDVDLRGKTVILTFGWTRDTDVTPATLQLLMAAIDAVGPKTEAIVPVFVSVDPERDGAAELEAISARYGHNIVPLRGDSAAISAMTQAFRFPVTRISDTMLPGGYTLDHPAVYYVLDKDGSFRGAVPYTTDVQALAGDFRKLAR